MKVYTTPCGKSYTFERHALDRMSQRRIKRKDVERVLDNHDACYPDVRGNHCFVGNLGDSRRLRLVVVKDSNPQTIITVIILD